LGGKRHVCAGLRRVAGQRRSEITQTFLDAASLSIPGGAGEPSTKTQKSKFAKSKSQKLQNRKNQNLENFHRNVFREIDLDIVSGKIVFLFSRSTARV
jgi:hypothetical protein